MMESRKDESLFPTTTSFFIFWSYISLFVSQGLLVTTVQKSQIHGFNTAVVVLLTESVKLLICILVYVWKSQGGGLAALLYDLKTNRKLLILYLVPAFLYCLYNNLTFVNLELFDLATYYCLMQFRIVLTAVIYQFLFRRKLTKLQWISLIILTLGCLIKEFGLYKDLSKKQSHVESQKLNNVTSSHNDSGYPESNHQDSNFNPIVKFMFSSLLLIFQMFCSCFAGVYNEFLLKDSSTARGADVILQNIFMYVDSIIGNMIVYGLAPETTKSLNASLKAGRDVGLSVTLINLLTSPLVIILILNNAFSGLVASFFLKSLNSILKTFASALELFVVTFLAWILFNNEVDEYTIIALLLVTAAMYIYSKNPVSVSPPGRVNDNRGNFTLLKTDDV